MDAAALEGVPSVEATNVKCVVRLRESAAIERVPVNTFHFLPATCTAWEKSKRGDMRNCTAAFSCHSAAFFLRGNMFKPGRP